MNPRERTLAIAVGAIAVLLVGWFLFQGVEGRFSTRRARIADLEGKLSKQKQQVLLSRIAMRKQGEYEERSLPSEAAPARSLYQQWLLEQVTKADIDQPKVTVVASRDERGAFMRHQFTVSGQARLDKIIQLLYALHRVDLLHRISQLKLTPQAKTKDLTLHLTIEALALRGAPPEGPLPLNPAPRLATTKLEDFAQPILDRNLFGPPNRAPQLAAGLQSTYTNKPLEVSLKATDLDALDKVTFRLVSPSDTGAQLDPQTGKFRWTPKKPGKYEFLVEAIDDGIPARAKQDKLVVSVTDQPPPTPSGPKKLDFDDAKFTALTGIVAVDDEAEVWLFVRPRGKTLKLHEGDTFEIGSIKGRITQIGGDSFTFEVDGKLRHLHKGETLYEAQVESTTSTESSSQSHSIN